jgi:two-component system, NtrC family, nitrogen regulation sensor histidine kinase NtrY
LKKGIQYKSKFWLLCLAALLISLIYQYYLAKPSHTSKSIENAASAISQDVASYLQALDALIEKGTFNNLNFSKNPTKEISFLKGKSYTVALLQNDTPIFWTNNRYLYSINNAQLNQPVGLKLQNIDIVYYKRILPEQPTKSVIIYIPIKYNYKYPTTILKNNFLKANYGSADWTLRLSAQKQQSAIKVRNSTMFYIDANSANAFTEIESYESELLLVLPFILLLLILHNFAICAIKQSFRWQRVAIVLGAFVLFRVLNYTFNFPVNYTSFYLFSAKYFYSDFLFRSLGDTIINSIFIIYCCWLCRLLLKKVTIFSNVQMPKWLLISLVFVTLFANYGLYWVAQNLVSCPKLPFGPTLLENINENLILAFFALCTLFIAMFQIILVAISIIYKWFKLSVLQYFVCYIGTLFIFSLILLITNTALTAGVLYFLCLHLIVYGIFLYKKIQFSINPFSTKLFLAILILSAVVSGFVFNQQHTIHYQLFKEGSVHLLPVRDIKKEASLDNIANRIQNDTKWINNVTSKKWNVDSVAIYFGDKYFNALQEDENYKFALMQEGKVIVGNSTKSQINLDNIFERSEKTNNNTGYTSFRKNKRGVDAFLLKIPMDSLGQLYVEIKTEKFVDAKNEPSIWNIEDENISLLLKNTKYKLISGNKILFKSRYFEEPSNVDLLAAKDSVLHVGNITYYKYKVGLNKVIIFANKFIAPLKWFSLFGFVFVFLFIVIIGSLAFYCLLVTRARYLLFAKFVKLNLRVRVLIAQLFLQFLTFAILLLAGRSYNRTTVNKKNNAYFTEANQQIEAALVANTYLQESNKEGLHRFDEVSIGVLDSLQKITNFNFDLFTEKGSLVYSSMPQLYTDNYLSAFAMPNSLDSNMDHLSQKTDKINDYIFLTTYKKLSVKFLGEPIYLRVPFYNVLEETRREFLLTMTNYFNIFVLIFLITTLFSYFISMFFSRSLTRLVKSVGSLNVDSSSVLQKMDWPYYDEVRILVDQYHKVEQELKLSIAKLTERERDSAWREMAKQVAHEIKNPITPITLSLQNMLRRLEKVEDITLKEKLVKSIDSVLQQIESLNNIATSFGEFADIPKENKQLLEVNTELHTQLNLLKNNSLGIQFVEELAGSEMFLWMDKDHFKRVVNNLVINAMQAVTDTPNATIIVKTELMVGSNEVCIKVQDNGNGITSDIQAKIFDADFTTKASGKGLGLAMCKDIITLMHGSITFTSSADTGTCFIIILPLK